MWLLAVVVAVATLVMLLARVVWALAVRRREPSIDAWERYEQAVDRARSTDTGPASPPSR